MTSPFRFCVAPMMDWTDRHERFFLRLISRRARLYTEMITADAIRYGDRARLLDYNVEEHPVALQLGGSDPEALAEASQLGAEWGYDEINLNVGCPSDRVQSGRFGACLMREPDLVARCVSAMRSAIERSHPNCTVTVKCRLGVDEQDPAEALVKLVDQCQDAGVTVFIIHARKAWLSGLSPRENRDVPPLEYEWAYRIKRSNPQLTVVVNGGITDLASCTLHLDHVDGVMLGRAAYKDPYLLSQVDPQIFGEPDHPISREEILEAYIPYVERMQAQGLSGQAVTRHILGLYAGCAGGRMWRRFLSERIPTSQDAAQTLADSLALIRSYQQQAA